MDKSLKRKLISTRKIIKGKIQTLKEGAHSREIKLEKSYKLLTKSLKELSTKLHDNVTNIKQHYIEKMLSDNSDEYNIKTGVRHDVAADKFQIGNSF